MPITLPDARHLSDHALQALRLRALRGLELGYSASELADILGVCRETISRWWAAYRAEGLDALPGDRTGRPPGSGCLLTDEQARHVQICIDSSSPEHCGVNHTLWTRRAIGDLIRKDFGIDLADRTAGEYLRRWGYTVKKPARHSRHQDPDDVDRWLNETYPAIEEKAEEVGAEILWVDEVGVHADHHPGRAYARVGERAQMDVPKPHIKVNQITAISNQGAVQSMGYDGGLNAAVYLKFLGELVAQAAGKVLVIADGLRAHKTPEVLAWVAERSDQIELFFLPPYSPEMNPVEYLNNDMKGEINKEGMPDSKGGLREQLAKFMGKLSRVPAHVMGYFLHTWTQYAAAEL